MAKVNRVAQDRQIRMVLDLIKSSGPMETFSDVVARVRKNLDFKVGATRVANVIEAEQFDPAQLYKARQKHSIMTQVFARIDTLNARVNELERRLAETPRS